MQIERFKFGANPPETEFEKSIEKGLNEFTKQVLQVLNAGVRFADNFDAQLVTVTTAASDTEVIVAHTLKRVPIGYLVYSRDKAGIVYDSGTAFTTTNIYIKCSAATTALKLLVF